MRYWCIKLTYAYKLHNFRVVTFWSLPYFLQFRYMLIYFLFFLLHIEYIVSTNSIIILKTENPAAKNILFIPPYPKLDNNNNIKEIAHNIIMIIDNRFENFIMIPPTFYGLAFIYCLT